MMSVTLISTLKYTIITALSSKEYKPNKVNVGPVLNGNIYFIFCNGHITYS